MFYITLQARRFGSCTLWIGVDELALIADNAKVRKIDSERRCIKCEIFRIKLLHFIHVHFALSRFRTFAFYNFPCLCMRHRPLARRLYHSEDIPPELQVAFLGIM